MYKFIFLIMRGVAIHFDSNLPDFKNVTLCLQKTVFQVIGLVQHVLPLLRQLLLGHIQLEGFNVGNKDVKRSIYLKDLGLEHLYFDQDVDVVVVLESFWGVLT